MNNNITRREFIKKEILALTGLGLTSTLVGCKDETSRVTVDLQKSLYELVFTDESLDKYESYYDDILPLAEGLML